MRPTIGLLINNFDNEYQRAILSGVQSVCLRRDANLVCLSGGLRSNSEWQQQKQDSPLMSLSPANYDGLLMVSALISGGLDLDSLAGFVRSISGTRPLVNIGPPHPSFASVDSESGTAIRALVDHLVIHHGRRRFVYMGGWEGNPDEEQRRRGFLSALEAHGLRPVDTGLLRGNFVYDSARAALGEWLKADREFDAVVAANDTMAFGCFDELTSCGVAVPEGVSLTGYDDFPSAEHFDIPLTTANQQTEEFAAAAAEELLSQIAGGSPAGRRVFHGKPWIRQSCGCVSAESRYVVDVDAGEELGPLERQMVEHFDQVLQHQITPAKFLRTLGATLRLGSLDSGIGAEWDHWVTSLLHRSDAPTWPQDVHLLLHQARITIREASEGRRAALHQRSSFRARTAQTAASRLSNSLSRNELFENLTLQLPDLGVSGCWVMLWDRATTPPALRLVYQLSQGHSTELPAEGVALTEDRILPEDRRTSRFSCILETLIDDSGPLGFVVYELVRDVEVLVDAIGFQVRNALKSVLLLERLQEANRQIQAGQEQIILSEKMAVLGGLVTGLSHEINTPLGVALTATSFVDERLKSLAGPRAPDLKSAIPELREAVGLGLQGLQRVGDLVNGFRQIAVELSGDEERLFDLGSFLREIVQSLVSIYQPGKHRVVLECPDGLEIRSFPGVYLQIVTHLTNNAVTHGLQGRENGQIKLSVQPGPTGIRMEFSDNGRGLNASGLAHLFEPFSSSLRNQPGMGLGTFIVYNLVTQKLRGTIRAESSENQGLIYRIEIPTSTVA